MMRALPLVALLLASCASSETLRELRAAEEDVATARELVAEATDPAERKAAEDLLAGAQADVEEARERVEGERVASGASAVQIVASAALQGLLAALGVGAIAGGGIRRRSNVAQ